MPVVGGRYINPFYQQVDGDVSTELKFRANAYGTRVRVSEKGDPTKLLWSYGKTAWAQVFSEDKKNSVSLGTEYSKLMSDSKGKLLLYDSARNVPKYPLLQSLTISNEGTIGSLLKGSFDFIIYPHMTKGGFTLENVERAYFKPGKEVLVKWGWSVRSDKKVNRGQLQGIIYNFEWSVQTDLAISAKVSFVSKATIAIGISGEQHNPNGDTEQDAQGKPIPNSDIAGIIEQDIATLGGKDKYKAITLDGPAIPEENTKSAGKFGKGIGFKYYVLGIPRSIRDMPQEQLTVQQQQIQAADQQRQQDRLAQNEEIKGLITIIYNGDLERANYRKQTANISGITLANPPNTIDDKYRDYFTKNNNTLTPAMADERRQQYLNLEVKKYLDDLRNLGGGTNTNNAGTGKKWTESDLTTFYNAAIGGAQQLLAQQQSNPQQTVDPNLIANPWADIPPPTPIADPTFYVALGNIATFMNALLKTSPVGSIAQIQVGGNTTQYLPDVVSTMPDKVFFPDPSMGGYGTFKPFTSNLVGNPLDIGKILISTNCLIETYREFVLENQTNIPYKNITNFWDSLIKKVNFASGETYQLTTRLIDPGTLPGLQTNGKAILSIEDTNISKSVTDRVSPFEFTPTIAAPIVKSVNISSKPPGPLAAASYVNARGGSRGKSQQIDVSVGLGGDAGELTTAKDLITKIKESLTSVGVSEKFHTDLKGAYAGYKRASTNVGKAHWLNKALYPVNFSITIDGVNGFKFGDVIKTTLIPTSYNQAKMVFVVTKIQHTIKDGVWETTLETKSRLNAGNVPA